MDMYKRGLLDSLLDSMNALARKEPTHYIARKSIQKKEFVILLFAFFSFTSSLI
jgi:hypothetical protein